MKSDKLLRYIILFMIISSATFYYGAYAAGIAAFLIMLIKNFNAFVRFAAGEKAFLPIFAVLALSTVFSKVPQYSLFIDGIILVHFMVYAVIVNCMKSEDFEKVSALLNAMGILLCIYGIYQYFMGDLEVISSWTDKKAYGSLVRIYSTMRNPNIYAAYLTFNLSHAVAYFIKKKAKIPFAINIILSSICLILTYSRGGFMAFIAAMLVVAIICKDKRAGFYLTAMIILYFSYNFIQNTNRESLSLIAYDSSSRYRLEIWKASWQLFKNSPVLGNGPGSVSQHLSYSSDVLRGFIFHSHNIFLQLLAETGALGLTAFMILIVCGIKELIFFWRAHRNNENFYIAVSFAASIAAIFVHGIVDCAVFIPSRSLIFVVYLSLFPTLFKKSATDSQST